MSQEALHCRINADMHIFCTKVTLVLTCKTSWYTGKAIASLTEGCDPTASSTSAGEMISPPLHSRQRDLIYAKPSRFAASKSSAMVPIGQS